MTLLDFEKGMVLLINKPLNWTSFDVVNKVRNETRVKKVGHAGTLDPLATGLLILCTGTFTKKIDTYQAQEKEYTGTITLGATTPSYDMETPVDQIFDTSNVNIEAIHTAAKAFVGTIQQRPPQHSAKKINGERAYHSARQGEVMDMPARAVTISEFTITAIEMPVISFKVVCEKGTYIRSLAYDLGKALNCGAYLSSLCRTRIGDFKLEDATPMDAFVAQMKILRAQVADIK
jgi:tRNA pseudouridine55 synthase